MPWSATEEHGAAERRGVYVGIVLGPVEGHGPQGALRHVKNCCKKPRGVGIEAGWALTRDTFNVESVSTHDFSEMAMRALDCQKRLDYAAAANLYSIIYIAYSDSNCN